MSRDGRKTGGGSRLGKPNKQNAAIKDMIVGALSDVGGQAYLAQQAKEQPVAFMGLVGKVLPMQITGDKDNPVVIQLVDFSRSVSNDEEEK